MKRGEEEEEKSTTGERSGSDVRVRDESVAVARTLACSGGLAEI